MTTLPAAEEASAFVYGYDERLLASVFGVLRSRGYGRIQSLPMERSLLAVVKEHQNLVNQVTRKQHLLFYPSVAPMLYRIVLHRADPGLALLLRACFLCEAVPAHELEVILGDDLVRRGIATRLILPGQGRLRFTASFVPFGDLIVLRDPPYAYAPKSPDPWWYRGVWVGADSIMFARYLTERFLGRGIGRVLELGSGAGIQTLVAAGHASEVVAVDVNPRAVAFTQLNAVANGLGNVGAKRSDLFEHVEGRFDVILANPWYCDLAKGGLEEVPGIVAGLGSHLDEGGECLMILNSYVKDGEDTLHRFLSSFAAREGYDVELDAIGYNIERDRLAALKEHGISHNVMYYAVLRRGGRGTVVRRECSLARRIRDFAYIYAVRTMIGRSGKGPSGH